jgi:hypothetical protein
MLEQHEGAAAAVFVKSWELLASIAERSDRSESLRKRRDQHPVSALIRAFSTGTSCRSNQG